MFCIDKKLRLIIRGCGKSSFINTLNRVNDRPQGDVTDKDWKIESGIYNKDVFVCDDISCVEVKGNTQYYPPEDGRLNINLLLLDACNFKKKNFEVGDFIILTYTDLLNWVDRRTIRDRVSKHYNIDILYIFLWRSYTFERYNEDKLDELIIRSLDVMIHNYSVKEGII